MALRIHVHSTGYIHVYIILYCIGKIQYMVYNRKVYTLYKLYSLYTKPGSTQSTYPSGCKYYPTFLYIKKVGTTKNGY